MKKSLMVLSLAASSVLFSACIGQTPEPEIQQESMEQQLETTDGVADQAANETEEVTEATVQPGAAQTEFSIDTSNFAFSETELTVPAGEEITITLTNSEGFHDLVIDELDVKSEQIAQGSTTQITFTASPEHIGQTYEYYCSVGAHRQQGMVGKITIVE